MHGVEIRPVGASALLVEVEDPLTWFAALVARREAGELSAVDIVPGARTVLLDGVPDPSRTARDIRGWPPPVRASAAPIAPVRLQVVYDGSDLPFVAAHWCMSVDAAIALLAATEFTVAFCGFAPGFAYLSGLPQALTVPRLPTPRAKVPSGSVALAGEYAGIYPSASPGGWRLVGRCDAKLFDIDAEPPALLAPGRTVHLEQA